MKICFEKGSPGTSDAEYVERYKARTVVDPERGCWLFQGFLHPKTGYGDSCYRGEKMMAHRAMYIAAKGPIPEGMFILHSCDVRNCINPDHLRIGTISENKQDELQRGRNWEASKTECPKGHPYVGENVVVDSRGWRHCRICDKIRQSSEHTKARSREYQRRKREARRLASLGMRRTENSGKP